MDANATAWEPQFRAAATKAFEEDKRAVLAILREETEKARRTKATVNWDTFQLRVENYLRNEGGANWRSTFVPRVQGLVSAQGEQWAAVLGLQFDVRDLYAEEHFTRYLLEFADPITTTSRDAILDLLAAARQAGWGPDRTRAQLGLMFRQWMQGDVDPTDFQFASRRATQYRTETIARTETMRSSNTGGFALFEAWEVPAKEWLVTLDGRERDSHRTAGLRYREGGDPGPIPLQEPFLVGGYRMQHPHDMSLGAPIGEVVNCRCVMLPVLQQVEPAESAPPEPPPIEPEPEPEEGPLGDPVSDALRFTRTVQQLQDVMAAVDAVHGDGQLPEIPVRPSTSRRVHGQFRYVQPNKPLDILITMPGEHPEITLVHEVGHFLDHAALPKGQNPPALGASASRDGDMAEVKAWRQACRDSAAIQELKRLRSQGSVTVTLADGHQHQFPVPKQWVAYLLGEEEMFARAYAQYVAVKSGDARLLNQLAALRRREGQVYYPQQWEDADFEPIREALDNLFRALGWMR